MRAAALSTLLASIAIAGCAALAPEAATCPSDAQVADMLGRFVAMQPVPNPPDTMTVEGGLCGRDKFNRGLAGHYGRVVGYKAGLTNAAVQKRFDYPAPVRGTLYERMILQDGAEVPARFGARPLFEADLVVEVASAAVHDAKTPLEVLASLRSIRPFLELPDLVVQDPTRIGGPAINLINVGARLGVLGAPIPATADARLADALRDMTVRLVDGTGKELDSGKGSAILGHPLNAVVWLAADLKRSGITLAPGDLLSLGSFSRLLPPQPGQTVRAVYEGLPGTPSVSVRFR
jgi:2-keto-4-pentenoate hydratase